MRRTVHGVSKTKGCQMKSLGTLRYCLFPTRSNSSPLETSRTTQTVPSHPSRSLFHFEEQGKVVKPSRYLLVLTYLVQGRGREHLAY